MMSSAPETRHSLLIRVRDPADHAAWREFVEIYRPVILWLAQHKGLQAADAEDIAQEVLVTVAKAVEQWEHDPEAGQIPHLAPSRGEQRRARRIDAQEARPRLGRLGIARGARPARDAKRARLGPLAAGVSAGSFPLGRATGPPGIPPGTWDAFWLTAVERRTVEAVAEEFAKDPGAIYARGAALCGGSGRR